MRLKILTVACLALTACGEGLLPGDPVDETDPETVIFQSDDIETLQLALTDERLPRLTEIRVNHSNQCLEALSNRTVVQTRCNGSNEQQWRVRPVANDPGHFELLGWTLHTGGMCLDLPGGSNRSGTDMQIFGCHNGDNQRFLIRSTRTGLQIVPKRNRLNNLCLDVEWNDQRAGRRLQQFQCVEQGNQRFTIRHLNPTFLRTNHHRSSDRILSFRTPWFSLARGERTYKGGSFYRWVSGFAQTSSASCPRGTDDMEFSRSSSSDSFWVSCYDDNRHLIAPVELDDREESCHHDNDLRIFGRNGAVTLTGQWGSRTAVVPVSSTRVSWDCRRPGSGFARSTQCPANTTEVEVTRHGDRFDVVCRAN